jgi:hypothetical protein
MRTTAWLMVFCGIVAWGPATARCDEAADRADSIERRIAGRGFPSVFQAWSGADNLPNEDRLTTVARHDLVFHSPGFFGLRWDQAPQGLGTEIAAESIAPALERRKTLLEKNPHLILLAEIRYRDAGRRFLPEGHRWWRRDKGGKIEPGWEEGGFFKLDFENPEYQEHVARRAGAVVASGVVDGVMLDWWNDSDAHLALIEKVRQAVGPEALILANANDRTTPRTAPFINGYFMECYRSKTPQEWETIAETLAWAEENLRRPRINCLETWYQRPRDDLPLMRATTTLSLALSDGYCLFSDPNPLPTPDHLHNWYPFWNQPLGTPVSAGVEREDGSLVREFTGGTVLYNPLGNRPVRVAFPEVRTSAGSGRLAREHRVGAGDGDFFLRAQPQP